MKSLLRRAARWLAFTHGRGVSLYLAICYPNGEEWAAWLKLHGRIHAMGEHCAVQTNVVITDPRYLRMGNNVRLSGCTLFGHDGSVNMLNRAYGLRLDSVGKIDIGDNVTVGHAAVIYPGVTIGSNVVVLGGAHVSKDLAPDSVYGGLPAKRVCSIAEFVARKKERSDAYPWRPLIERRTTAFDAGMQPRLDELRVAHFFAAT